VNDHGDPIVGDTLLVLMNAHHEAIPFQLPATNPDHQWELLFDTADDAAGPAVHAAGKPYPFSDRSLALFRTVPVATSEAQVTPLQAAAMRKVNQAATASTGTGSVGGPR
jgi:isoamylase